MGMFMNMSQRQEQRLEQRMLQRQEQRLEAALEIRQFLEEEKEHAPNYDLLLQLLSRVPQVKNRALNYVIAGGWAVDLLTNQQRPHNNINVIVLDKDRQEIGTGQHLEYFNIRYMLAPLNRSNVYVSFVDSIPVYTPCPEFMLTTKILPYKGEAPREKDLSDAQSIIERCDMDSQRLYRFFLRGHLKKTDAERFALQFTRNVPYVHRNLDHVVRELGGSNTKLSVL